MTHAERLVALHSATVATSPPTVVSPGVEDARLLREYAAAAVIELPRPALSADLATALVARRTTRAMAGTALPVAHLSALLAFAAGVPRGTAFPAVVGGPPGGRTYPSGGALYPVELLVCAEHVEGVAPAVCRYQVLAHRLAVDTPPRAIPPAVRRMHADNAVTGASLTLLFWIDFTRPSFGKYAEKAYRLALLEAGHVAQNVALVAAALGGAAAPLCGFDDEALAREAGLAYPGQAVVYAMAVGAP